MFGLLYKDPKNWDSARPDTPVSTLSAQMLVTWLMNSSGYIPNPVAAGLVTDRLVSTKKVAFKINFATLNPITTPMYTTRQTVPNTQVTGQHKHPSEVLNGRALPETSAPVSSSLSSSLSDPIAPREDVDRERGSAAAPTPLDFLFARGCIHK
jgi:hypothetical protein